MVFRLYDGGGFQIGSNKDINNVTVSDGVLSVELDFGDAAFTGDERVLQISVKCSSDSSFTDFGTDIALNATPYALSLRPGAIINGSIDGDNVLKVTNIATGTNTTAIYGRAGNATTLAGAPNTEVGVLGDSRDGVGVVGQSDTNSGVHGFSASNWAVYGYSLNSVGVYGWTDNSNSYGVYSYGNAHIEGNPTWKPITSVVSIPPAAFQPADSSHAYFSDGSSLNPLHCANSNFFAPVYLPNKAVVTDITF